MSRPFPDGLKTFAFNGKVYGVDATLNEDVLRALNSLPGLELYQVCSGHKKSAAYAMWRVKSYVDPDVGIVSDHDILLGGYLRAALLLYGLDYLLITNQTGNEKDGYRWHLELHPAREENGVRDAAWWWGAIKALSEFRP